jgi:hypothetical protein
MLYETGWPPDVLDRQPLERVMLYLVYKGVRVALETGGSFLAPEKPEQER